MTQSKKSDFEPTIDMSELELENIMEDDTITIDLNNTYGTTTTYWAGDSVTDVVYSGSNDGTFTIDINDLTTDTIDIDWLKDTRFTLEPTMFEDCMPDPQKLKKMCEQYPALAKVYENFKTVYSMVEQDWKGNHDDEDELPF
jgi:UDP-galactopyranose mutase